MARPTKLTDEVTRLVVAGIRTGATIQDAATVAGISRERVYEWMKAGERAYEYRLRVERDERIRLEREITPLDELCVEFYLAVREARSAFAVEHLDSISTAGTRSRERRVTTTDPEGKVTVRVEEVPPDPRASMWLLERRMPQVFGRVQRVELSAPPVERATGYRPRGMG